MYANKLYPARYFYLEEILLEAIFGVCLVSISNADSIILIPSFVDADLVIARVCVASKGLD